MKFIVEIELGNDAMRTADDVLKSIRRSLERLPRDEAFEDYEHDWPSGQLRDVNGNKVGEWEVVP